MNEWMYSRYSKKGVIYLKCDKAECKGTAKIDQGVLYTMITTVGLPPHMEREITELSALERMRKRAADDDSTSLRNLHLLLISIIC